MITVLAVAVAFVVSAIQTAQQDLRYLGFRVGGDAGRCRASSCAPQRHRET
jgi:hypothetical protein